MKTSGICNAQSARKHRRQGHFVQRTFGGRFQWFHPDCPISRIQLATRAAGGKTRLAMDIAKDVPDMVAVSHFSVPAKEITSTLSSKEYPPALFVDEPLKLPVKGAVAICPLTQIIVQQGGVYRPKRANQHSQNFNITEVDGTRIYYTRGESKVEFGEDITDLAPRIGRRVDVEN